MNKLPIQASIVGVDLVDFLGTQKLDLMPQIDNVNIYQSIFDPYVKADLYMNDPIGLLHNFPIVGEEFVVIRYTETGSEVELRKSFVINAIVKITPNEGDRLYNYVISLSSRLTYENSRVKISHAYNDTVSEIAKKVFDDYLRKPYKQMNNSQGLSGSTYAGAYDVFDDVEPSLENRTLVIPNLRPFDALQWLATKAVSASTTHSMYTFYEDLDGFHFKTIEEMKEDAAKRFEAMKTKNMYYYVTDASMIEKTGRFTDLDERKSIINVYFNNRYSTLDKVVDGYFENILVEINLYQNAYKETKTVVDDSKKLDNSYLNTTPYIEKAKAEGNVPNIATNIETGNKVKYVYNNAPDFDDNHELSIIRNKWGAAQRNRIGMEQIDVHVTIEGNTSIKPGDIFYFAFPEIHGFNTTNEDEMVSGIYIVTDVKHTFITASNKHITTLLINKDSYRVDINSMEYKYGNNDPFRQTAQRLGSI